MRGFLRSRIRAFVVAAVLAGGGILGGCLDQDSPSALSGLEKQISDNNQKGYQKIEEGAYEDALPFLNKAIEYVHKLDPELKDLKREVERSELIDSPFNNISWAYNELGDYAKGLDYIEKSLLILPNTDVEYVNKGNALNGLHRNEEALASYKQAVALNSRSDSAIYGMGLVSYEEGDYEEALAQFKKYLELVPSDTDAAEMVIDSLLALDRDEKAVKFADSFFKKYEDSYDGYMIKGYLLEETAEFEETERFYKQAGEKFPDLREAQLKLGELYYDNGDYDAAADHFNRLLNKFPDEPEVYTWLIWTASARGIWTKPRRCTRRARTRRKFIMPWATPIWIKDYTSNRFRISNGRSSWLRPTKPAIFTSSKRWIGEKDTTGASSSAKSLPIWRSATLIFLGTSDNASLSWKIMRRPSPISNKR
ncbi:hypothetical protein HMSSN036_20220 [Paenibacillus macerans]|nr:hypothetical protein HMSSN036_20220 [Paenibacillus macerans]